MRNIIRPALCALLLALPVQAAPRDNKVYAAVQANRAGFLDLLGQIVNIDSGTGDVAGGAKITALLNDGRIISIELPQSIPLEITDTAPGIKGATATGRTKPATLSNGVVVQVPEYMEAGERVKVNTETGKFMSRA